MPTHTLHITATNSFNVLARVVILLQRRRVPVARLEFRREAASDSTVITVTVMGEAEIVKKIAPQIERMVEVLEVTIGE